MKSHKNQKNQKVLGSKPMNVGKELAQRTKNLNKNIETIMGKTAKSKTESFDIENDLVMHLDYNGDTIKVEFNDYYNHDDFYMILDRQTLRNVAEFITNYLDE